MGDAAGVHECERIYREWDEAFAMNDAAALAQLYAMDATLESPSVPLLLKKVEGVCRGRDEIWRLFDVISRRKPIGHLYRTGYITDGRRLIWEYPRVTPDGDQVDLAEIMEIARGLITRHRVYWGWYAIERFRRTRQPDATPEEALANVLSSEPRF